MAETGAAPDGVVVVDKPAGWTSHDVVARSRRLLGTRKVGHAGTLDPDATGVLLLGVGRATRLLQFLSGADKRYEGVVVLGVETSTLDASGEVTATHDMSGVGLDDVRQVVARHFSGPIDQVPPMVSALKVEGRRLHELARQGVEVERAPRRVVVRSFEVDPVEGSSDAYRIAVECSSGTYVRSLAADVGRALGGGAHLRDLRRTSVGSFTLDEAVLLDDVGPDAVLSPAAALRDMPSVVVPAGVAVDVGHGKVLDRERLGLPAAGPAAGPRGGAGEPSGGTWAVHDEAGMLLAVYGPHRSGRLKPVVVLVPATAAPR